ncbi:hypothetical protein [Paenibacillus sp. GYB003]|uniref:hypothetical protein n=1 Tax=Paenibacillus sp. GYB003 TaxID=2994392 RepID=UPI002F96C474
MEATVNLFLRLKDVPDLNWDVVQFPSYNDKPNTYGKYDLHLIIPMKTSKHPDDQMRAMEVFFSDEIQTKMVRQTARVTTLKDPKYAKDFGQDVPQFRDKNIAGIFKSKPAPAPAYSKYHSKADSLLNAEFVKVMKGQKDVNTALRDAEEQIQQYIKSEKAK